MLTFLRMGYKIGPSIFQMLADETVRSLLAAVQRLQHEAHLFTGFLRFSDYQGVLIARIEPKNQVLPLLESHFSNRFANETFLIFDQVHKAALIHEKGRTEILPLDGLELGKPDETEQFFRRLWKAFYNAVGIEGRCNPRCRMTHMPKRYWGQMTEFSPAEDDAAPVRQHLQEQ